MNEYSPWTLSSSTLLGKVDDVGGDLLDAEKII